MPPIKRYANRKLYDTAAKRYITLDGIAELIRQGADVRVWDHETGEDITAQIQAQIIFEQEKKARRGLPRSVFTGLIQAGSDTFAQLRHALTSAAEWRAQVDTEIDRRLRALAAAGELEAAEAERLADLLMGAGAADLDANWPEATDIHRILKQRGVPSRGDMQRLNRQVAALAREVERLSADRGGRRRS
jgi:polyhydroxyalkanoate synthesis repressor PhaR